MDVRRKTAAATATALLLSACGASPAPTPPIRVRTSYANVPPSVDNGPPERWFYIELTPDPQNPKVCYGKTINPITGENGSGRHDFAKENAADTENGLSIRDAYGNNVVVDPNLNVPFKGVDGVLFFNSCAGADKHLKDAYEEWKKRSALKDSQAAIDRALSKWKIEAQSAPQAGRT